MVLHAPPTHFGIALCFTVLRGIARSSNPACVASTTDMQKLRQAHVLLLVDPIHLFCWLTIGTEVGQSCESRIGRSNGGNIHCQRLTLNLVNSAPETYCVSFWNQGEITSLELIRFDYFG